MNNGNSLPSQSARDTAASKTTSPTEAGHSSNQPSGADNFRLEDAINQVFALFRVNYHNQYHAAYGDTQLLNQAKKLWFEVLGRFSPQQVMQAARQIIEQSEYLPTLHRMIDCCEEQGSANGVPALRDAYLEACSAPSPKAAFNWSHPVVYHAGRKAGWYLLSNESEEVSFPRFRESYRALCQQLANGAEFAPPETLLEEISPEPLDKNQQLKHLEQLRKELAL
jgi:hypothetical protein